MKTTDLIKLCMTMAPLLFGVVAYTLLTAIQPALS